MAERDLIKMTSAELVEALIKDNSLASEFDRLDLWGKFVPYKHVQTLRRPSSNVGDGAYDVPKTMGLCTTHGNAKLFVCLVILSNENDKMSDAGRRGRRPLRTCTNKVLDNPQFDRPMTGPAP